MTAAPREPAKQEIVIELVRLNGTLYCALLRMHAAKVGGATARLQEAFCERKKRVEVEFELLNWAAQQAPLDKLSESVAHCAEAQCLLLFLALAAI